MATDKFAIGEALTFGWETFKKNWGLLIIIILILTVMEQIPNGFKIIFGNDNQLIYIIIAIIFGLLTAILTMGQMKICLKLYDGETTSVGDLFSCFHLFFKYFVGSLIYVLIILGGLILLIVPGIIWAIKYHYYLYLIIDKELGPIEAIKQSGVITQSVKWDLFLFGLVCIGVAFLGILACCVGIFVSLPVVMIAGAYVYRKLQPRVEPKPITPFSTNL